MLIKFRILQLFEASALKEYVVRLRNRTLHSETRKRKGERGKGNGEWGKAANRTGGSDTHSKSANNRGKDISKSLHAG